MPRPQSLKIDEIDALPFYNLEDPLSSVYPIKVIFEGVEYKSAEHAYQVQKFDSNKYINIVREIMNADNGVNAKEISWKYRKFFRQDWNRVKIRIMYEILQAKVYQNPGIQTYLINTGNTYLYEDSPDNTEWGMVRDSNNFISGSNFIGRILMRFRSELINET